MLAVDSKVSDLIFSPGRPPQVELTGDLEGVPIPGLESLTNAQIKTMADLMLEGNPSAQKIAEKAAIAVDLIRNECRISRVEWLPGLKQFQLVDGKRDGLDFSSGR